MGHVDASSRVCPRCVWAGKLGFAGVSGGRKVLSSRNGAPQPDLGLMRNGRGIPGREDAGVVGCVWLWLWAVVGAEHGCHAYEGGSNCPARPLAMA